MSSIERQPSASFPPHRVNSQLHIFDETVSRSPSTAKEWGKGILALAGPIAFISLAVAAGLSDLELSPSSHEPVPTTVVEPFSTEP